MPVERPNAEPRPRGDVLERGGAAVRGEDRAGASDQLVVVPAGVGSLGAVGLDLGLAHSI